MPQCVWHTMAITNLSVHTQLIKTLGNSRSRPLADAPK